MSRLPIEMTNMVDVANDLLRTFGHEPITPHQPYMDNDAEIDRIDYTCIIDSLGALNMISTQVLQDVADDLIGEIESRSVEIVTNDDVLPFDLERHNRQESAIIDADNRREINL